MFSRTKVVVTTEDGRFTLEQSEEAEHRGQWFLEAEVNTEGSYMSATMDGDTLLRLADIVRGAAA